MTTKQKGDISEAKVIAAFLSAGKQILIPFGDRSRYDLVVDSDGVFERIQVKTAVYKNGIVKFSSKSVSTKNGKTVSTPYHGQIEKFVAYCPELDTLYVVPVAECGKDKVVLRVTVSKNKQKRKIKFAKDYEWSIV